MENTNENMSRIMIKYISPRFTKISLNFSSHKINFSILIRLPYLLLYFELWALMISARNGYLG